MSTTSATPTLDIRTLGPCDERKARVLAAFDALASGESLVVVNDHEPRGLRAHFDALRQGSFVWRSLEAGPLVYRVQIERT